MPMLPTPVCCFLSACRCNHLVQKKKTQACLTNNSAWYAEPLEMAELQHAIPCLRLPWRTVETGNPPRGQIIGQCTSLLTVQGKKNDQLLNYRHIHQLDDEDLKDNMIITLVKRRFRKVISEKYFCTWAEFICDPWQCSSKGACTEQDSSG